MLVPLLSHNSCPWRPSLAEKNRVPLTLVRWEGYEPVAAGVDVLDHEGAGSTAVALPQLLAVSPVAGREEERAVHVGELRGVVARVDVCLPEDDGAGRRSVAFPKFLARIVARCEE